MSICCPNERSKDIDCASVALINDLRMLTRMFVFELQRTIECTRLYGMTFWRLGLKPAREYSRVVCFENFFENHDDSHICSETVWPFAFSRFLRCHFVKVSLEVLLAENYVSGIPAYFSSVFGLNLYPPHLYTHRGRMNYYATARNHWIPQLMPNVSSFSESFLKLLLDNSIDHHQRH